MNDGFFVSKLLATILILGVVIFGSPSVTTKAQTTNEAVAAREARLRAVLVQTEKEIAQWPNVLTLKQKESASIERDAAILNAKIEEAKLVIKARNIAIERLG